MHPVRGVVQLPPWMDGSWYGIEQVQLEIDLGDLVGYPDAPYRTPAPAGEDDTTVRVGVVEESDGRGDVLDPSTNPYPEQAPDPLTEDPAPTAKAALVVYEAGPVSAQPSDVGVVGVMLDHVLGPCAIEPYEEVVIPDPAEGHSSASEACPVASAPETG